MHRKSLSCENKCVDSDLIQSKSSKNIIRHNSPPIFTHNTKIIDTDEFFIQKNAPENKITKRNTITNVDLNDIEINITEKQIELCNIISKGSYGEVWKAFFHQGFGATFQYQNFGIDVRHENSDKIEVAVKIFKKKGESRINGTPL